MHMRIGENVYTIFLDMDGVLADFERHVCDWYDATNNHPNEWEYHYREDFGVSGTEFWEGLTVGFWESMPKTAEADMLMAMVEHHNPVILSSPPMAGQGMPGVKGTLLWLKKHYTEIYKEKRYLLGSCKEYCAHPKAILIDDKNENVLAWNERGGRGILVPQPWNALRHVKENGNSLEFIQGALMEILKDEY